MPTVPRAHAAPLPAALPVYTSRLSRIRSRATHARLLFRAFALSRAIYTILLRCAPCIARAAPRGGDNISIIAISIIARGSISVAVNK